MSKRAIFSDEAPAPGGGYSQAIESGGLVFLAGQGPLDPSTGEVIGETIEEQTELTIENVVSILRAAGLGLEDVVKTTVHLSDIGLFGGFDATYRRMFPEPYPARTTVASGLLGIMVEIDVVAIRSE